MFIFFGVVKIKNSDSLLIHFELPKLSIRCPTLSTAMISYPCHFRLYLQKDGQDSVTRDLSEDRAQAPPRGDEVGLHHRAAFQGVVILGLHLRPRPQ